MTAVAVEKPVLFASKSRDLRLVRRPKVEGQNALGRGFIVQEGVTYVFESGVLELTPGQDVLDDGDLKLDDAGRPLRDEQGRMTGEREFQDAISWMRAHPRKDLIGTHGSFVEVGAEPDRVPQPDVELEEVIEHTVTLNPQALRDLVARERAGHNRPLLIDAAEKALQRVEDAIVAAGLVDSAEGAGTSGNDMLRDS